MQSDARERFLTRWPRQAGQDGHGFRIRIRSYLPSYKGMGPISLEHLFANDESPGQGSSEVESSPDDEPGPAAQISAKR